MAKQTGNVRGAHRARSRRLVPLSDQQLVHFVVATPDARFASPDSARSRLRARWSRQWTIGFVIFTATAGLRLFHIDRSYDAFLDELIYSRISAGAAVNGHLQFDRFPFYLHGPLSFYWQAGLIHLFGISGTAIQVLDDLRPSNAVCGGVIAVALWWLIRQVSTERAALAAVALFSLDPFIISFDSRLYIETFVSMWVVLGYVAMLALATDRGVADSRAPRGRPYLVGFLFGLALLSKETSAALYMLPLLWSVLRGWPIARPHALRALGTAIAVYLPYPIVALATGGWSQFAYQKFGGVERMLGIIRTTGLNRRGAPSFLSRISADGHTFAATYTLIALGSLATLYLLRVGDRKVRLVAAWAAAAFALMAFQVLQGTLETQMFYYLVVPSILVVCISAERMLSSGPRFRVWAPCLVLGLVIMAFDAATWLDVHLGTDQAIVETVDWMDSHVPAGSRVAPLADGIQDLLPADRLLFNPEAGDLSPQQLRAADTQFAITSSTEASQGYSAATPRLMTWLRGHARVVHRASGATAGTVIVWQLSTHLPLDAPPGPQVLNPEARFVFDATPPIRPPRSTR